MAEIYDYLFSLQQPSVLIAGTPTAGGSVTAGTHSYKVTFVATAGGETTPSAKSNVITAVTTSGQTVPLSGIPIGPAGTGSRRLYRTVAGDSGTWKFLVTLANNTATTYSDTKADGDLDTDAPSVNTTLSAPDYNYTLIIKAQGQVTEEGYKNQVIHLADNNSEERITLFPGSIFYVSWAWAQLSATESGTIFDLYHDPVKANAMGRSFIWAGHDDHNYTTRFDCKLSRVGNSVNRWGLPGIKIRLLGRAS